jgi:hypothetical protein
MCNVKELRYQFSSVYMYLISKSVNYRRNIPVGGIQDTASCKSLLVLLYTLASADRFVTGYGWIVVFVDCGCKPAKWNVNLIVTLCNLNIAQLLILKLWPAWWWMEQNVFQINLAVQNTDNNTFLQYATTLVYRILITILYQALLTLSVIIQPSVSPLLPPPRPLLIQSNL